MVTEKVIIQFRADGTRVVQRDINQIKQTSAQAATSAAKLKKELRDIVPTQTIRNLQTAAGAARRLGEVQRELVGNVRMVTTASGAAGTAAKRLGEIQRSLGAATLNAAGSQDRATQAALAGARATRTVSSSAARLKSVQAELAKTTTFTSRAMGRLRAVQRRVRGSSANLARQQRRLAMETRETGKAAQFLRRAFAGIGLLVLARGLIRSTDAFTQLTNRVRINTSSEEELIAVRKRLFAISTATNTSIEANAELFGRLTAASKDLGTTQAEVLQFTESLNKAVKISGASSIEAFNAIRQLGQGLSAGALRGEELNAVLEQLPFVARVIEQDLGKTRGELRKLAEQGKITSEVILGAFRRARKDIDEQFGQVTFTIADRFVDIKNAVIELAGAFNSSTGAGQAFSTLLVGIADSIRILKGLIEDDTIINFFKEIFKFVAQTTGTGIGFGGLIDTDALSELSDEQAIEFADRFRQGIIQRLTKQGIVLPPSVVKNFLAGASGADKELKSFLKTGKESATVSRVQAAALERQAKAFEDVRGQLTEEGKLLQLTNKERSIQNEITKVQNALKKEGIEFGKEGAPGSLLELEFIIRKNAEIAQTQAVLEQILAPERERAELIRIVNELEDKGLITKKQVRKALEEEKSATDQLIDSLKEERTLIAGTSRERAIAAVRLQATNALIEEGIDIKSAEGRQFIALAESERLQNEILTEKQRILDMLNPTEEERAETLRLINEITAEQNLSAEQRNELLKKTGLEAKEAGGFAAGFAAQFLAIDTSAKGLGESLGGALVRGIDKGSSALAEFLVTGAKNTDQLKEAVSQLLRDLAKEVIQLIIKLLIVAAIKKALGGDPFSAGITGAQAGGFVQAGEARIVGEQGPEPFVPTQSGRVLPNQALQPQEPPRITVVNVSDPDEISAFLNSDEGGDIILNQLGARNKQARDTLGV